MPESNRKHTSASASFPFVTSLATVFAAAGAAKFGLDRIVDYGAGSYDEPDQETVNDIRLTLSILAVVVSIIIMSVTRVPSIYREYYKRAAETEEDEDLREDLIATAVYEMFNETEQALTFEQDPEDNSGPSESSHPSIIPIESMTIAVTTTPGRVRGYAHTAPQRRMQVTEVTRASEEKHELTIPQHAGKFIVSTFLKGLGLSSITFASLITFLGTVTFFKFLGGDPTEHDYPKELEIFLEALMYTAAGVTVVSKFYSSYTYVYLSATKKSAESIANWSIGLKNPNQLTVTLTRWQEAKKYGTTLGLSIFSIISAPFLAFYTTQQTLLNIPYLNYYTTFIFNFSLMSTFSSFVNDTISKSPAVRETFEAWWYNRETNSAKIKALLDARMPWLTGANIGMFVVGSIDSALTGASYTVYFMLTSHVVFGADLYNPYLFAFASACGVSATFINYAFSVRRGWHDFMADQIYKASLARDWVIAPSEQTLLEEAAPTATTRTYVITHIPHPDEIPTEVVRASVQRQSLAFPTTRVSIKNTQRTSITYMNGDTGREHEHTNGVNHTNGEILVASTNSRDAGRASETGFFHGSRRNKTSPHLTSMAPPESAATAIIRNSPIFGSATTPGSNMKIEVVELETDKSLIEKYTAGSLTL